MKMLVTCVLLLVSMATALVYPLCHSSCQSGPLCGRAVIFLTTFLLIMNCGAAYGGLESNCLEGTILPRDPMFVQGQNLTLVCSANTIRSKHLKFVRGSNGEQLPEKYVQKINRTAIKLEFPVTEADIKSHSTSMQYRCIKRRKGRTDVCIDNVYVQLDYKPEPPTNVTCRLYDFSTINCTWSLGVKYIHNTDIDCQYFSVYYDHGDLMYKSDNDAAAWQACPQQVGNSCIWANEYFTDPLVLYVKLTVSNSQNKVESKPKFLKFNKYDISVPGPVENLVIHKTDNPRCVTVDWTPSLAGSGRDFVYNMTYQSNCSELKSRKIIYNGTRDRLDPVIVCGLNPYTEYIFTVRGRILAPKQFDNVTEVEKGLWSPSISKKVKTNDDVIDVNPYTSPGLYEIDTEKSIDQVGYATLRMYWTPLSDCDQHSPHEGIYYTILAYNISNNATYEKFYDQINIPQNHGMINITIQARNEVGGPKDTSFITVFPTRYAPNPSELIVKYNDTNSDCMMFAVINVRDPDPVQHTVVWCKGTLFCQEPIRWQILNTNQTKYQFPQSVCMDTMSYRFGLVTRSYHDELGLVSDTGIRWTKCAYQIAKVPTEPLPNVVVIAGPVLEVRWSEYDCNEIRAYVMQYNVSFCETSSNTDCKCSGPLIRKVVNRNSTKYIDDSLPNDTKVCVWVIPVTSSGPVLSTKPVHVTLSDENDAGDKDLSGAAIIGIVVGCIIGVVVMSLAVFCGRKCFTKCKTKNTVNMDALYESAPSPNDQYVPAYNEEISDSTPMIQQTSHGISDTSSGIHTQSSYVGTGELLCNSESIELAGYTGTDKILSLSFDDIAEYCETASETEDGDTASDEDVRIESVSVNSQSDLSEIHADTGPVESHSDGGVTTQACDHVQDCELDNQVELSFISALQCDHKNETNDKSEVFESDTEPYSENTSALFCDKSEDLSGYDDPDNLELDSANGLNSSFEESEDKDNEIESENDVNEHIVLNTGEVSDNNSSSVSIDDYLKYTDDSGKPKNGLNGYRNGLKMKNGFCNL